MSLLEHLVSGSYRGVTFPVIDFEDQHAQAFVEHKAWRVPGADIEHVGREPVRSTITIGLLNTFGPRWGTNLFPGLFRRLAALFSAQPQGRLQHPLLGGMQVQVVGHSYKIDHRCQAGTTLQLQVVENFGSLQLTAAMERPEPTVTLVSAAEATDAAVAALGLAGSVPALAPSFDTQLTYLEDDDRSAAEAYGALAQAQSVAATILTAPSLAGIEGHDARAEARAARAASWSYAERYLTPKPRSRTFTVPARMGLARVAALPQVYGDPSLAHLLRQANEIPDELFVPAGTVLVVPDAA